VATRQRRLARILGLAAIVLVAAAAVFYGSMNWAARHEADRRGLPSGARNSIQHAYAAVETYVALRRIGLSHPRAVHGTVWLGYLNEWAEAIFKWPGDSTAEVYKDLHNNLLGAIGGHVAEVCRGSFGSFNERLSGIGAMAERRQLAWRQTDSRVPPFTGPLNVGQAIARHEADQQAIANTFLASITPADCPNAPRDWQPLSRR
jgi:hypothetical protein